MKNDNPRYKILITPTSIKPDSNSPAIATLRTFAHELVFNPTGKPLAGRELIELLEGCDGVIAGLDDYSAEVINATCTAGSTGFAGSADSAVFIDATDATGSADSTVSAGSPHPGIGRLKVISRYGSGYDNIDLAAARANGVKICCTPGANAESVADLAFGLMLCLARRLPALDRKTKSGEWTRSIGIELFGKTIGIVGLGAVGKGVVKRAGGFSMRVLAYEVAPDIGYAKANNIALVSFDELIRASDIISLHIPLTSDTYHIINREVISRMKPGALLINTARGGLLDETAAYDALVSGRLGGLGLDAYEEEPPKSSPLFSLDNVVLTPHTGSHTADATANLAEMSVRNLIDILSGRPCKYIINC